MEANLNLALVIDGTFILGVGATIAAVVVFVGSVWLLLAVLLGGRLAYFITASVTIAFFLIMTIVWSIGTPLGPVGEFGKPVSQSLPHWDPVDIATSQDELGFAPAADYPDAPWADPNQDDQEQLTRASELEGDAEDYLASSIDRGRIEVFEQVSDAVVRDESVKLLETEDGLYGMVVFEPNPTALEEEDEQDEVPRGATVYVVMKFAPGNPLGKARVMAAGTFLLLVAHLFGLSRAEQRARREREAVQEGASKA